MAILPVSLAESLRGARVAGITHILRESAGDQPDASINDAPLPSVASVHEDCAQPIDTTAAQLMARRRPPEEPTAQPTPQPATAIEATTHSSPPAPQPQYCGHKASPEAWEKLQLRTAPAPLLWTYAELGADLTGRGSPERSQCLKALIGRLSLPRGSSAFWPLSLPDGDGDAAPEPDNFQKGIRHIKPTAIVFLGPNALPLSGLDLTITLPYTQQIFQGKIVILLPDIDSLVTAGESMHQAVIFLRTALAGVTQLAQS